MKIANALRAIAFGVCGLLVCNSVNADIWINEIDYDQPGIDNAEFVEIAVADSMLASFQDITLEIYNQNGDIQSSFGFADLTEGARDTDHCVTLFGINLPTNGLQNGPNDGLGIHLDDGAGNITLLELLSYEGTFTGAAGTAWASVASTNIGVSETNATPNVSLSRIGTGDSAGDFTWATTTTTTFNSVNEGQTFLNEEKAAVPEPGSLGMLGLFALGFLRRKRS